MRKESEVIGLSSDEEQGLLKKGSRITSMFQRLTVLSNERNVDEGWKGAESEDEREGEEHISFSAEDSPERERHAVNIYGTGNEEPFHYSNAAGNSASAEHFEPDKTNESHEAARVRDEESMRRDFEEPHRVPEFLRQSETAIETPSLPEPEPEFNSNFDPVKIRDEMFGEREEPEASSESSAETIENEAEKEAVVNGYEVESETTQEQSRPEPETAEPVLTLTEADLERILSPLDFVNELKNQNVKPKGFVRRLRYQETLRQLQIECVKLQKSIARRQERVVVIFEGMELSGKYDTIRKFTKYMDPRTTRVVSLNRRSPDEKSEWYFQRYTKHLPKPGEIVFFNRSWYDRGVLEPIHGLCTEEEYGKFLHQAPEFEYMLIENGIKIIKIWLSISSEKQVGRFKMLQGDPLRDWKNSPFDEKYLERWSGAAKYRNLMLSWTHKDFSPWTIVSTEKRRRAKLECIRHVLSMLEYDGKHEAEVSIMPDVSIVNRFHRSMINDH